MLQFSKVFVWCFLVTNVFCQQDIVPIPEYVKLAGERHWIFESEKVGDVYDIYVQLPTNYQIDRLQKYPLVIYADANINLGSKVKQVVQDLTNHQELEEVILVGIGHQGDFASKRRRDFMPGDQKTAKGTFISKKPNKGQADQFYKFLELELLPFINNQYRCNQQSLWIGHSFSALFGVYALLKNGQLFDSYLCISPSLWVNHGNIYQIEANCFEKAKDLKGQLYLYAGSFEVLNFVLPYVRGFSEKLASRKYQKLDHQKEEFTGKNHHTVVIPALEKGLIKLLGK